MARYEAIDIEELYLLDKLHRRSGEEGSENMAHGIGGIAVDESAQVDELLAEVRVRAGWNALLFRDSVHAMRFLLGEAGLPCGDIDWPDGGVAVGAGV